MTGLVDFGKQARETHQTVWEQIEELKLEEILLLEKGPAFLIRL